MDAGGTGGDGILMASFTPRQPSRPLSHSSGGSAPWMNILAPAEGGGAADTSDTSLTPQHLLRSFLPLHQPPSSAPESAPLSPEALACLKRPGKCWRNSRASDSSVRGPQGRLGSGGAATGAPGGPEVLGLMSASSNRLRRRPDLRVNQRGRNATYVCREMSTCIECSV